MEQIIKTEVWLPWRATESRMKAFNYVRAWYEKNGFTVRLVDVEGKIFNLSACRNKAVRDSDADVIIISDADTFPQIEQLNAAISAAYKTNITTLPYTAYHSLGDTGSKQVYGGLKPEDAWAYIVDIACSGVYVTTKEAWAKHNGQDEIFAGWGCEDSAWEYAQKTLVGSIPRIDGKIFAFTHIFQEKEGEQTKQNYGRIYMYEQAAGNKEQMTELTTEYMEKRK